MSFRSPAWCVAVFLMVALGGCGGSSPEGPTAGSTPSAAVPTVTAAATATPSATRAADTVSAAPTATPSEMLATPTAPADADDSGRQTVSGTSVTLTPPNGFTPTATFAGFEEPGGASILVVELPAPVEEIRPELTPEALAGEGVQEIQRDS